MALWDMLAERFGEDAEAVLIPGAPRLTNKIFDRLQRRALKPILRYVNFSLVVEVGVGVGRWIPCYTRKDTYVIGIDVSRGMLRVLKHKVMRSRLQNVDLILASANAVPLRSGIADLSLSITCVQHIVEKGEFESALCEILRCTRRLAIFLESKSRKEPVRLHVYYPTILLPIQDYIRVFDKWQGRIIQLRGVDFLPLFWFLERLRDLVYAHHPGLRIPILGGSLRIRLMRNLYHVFSCVSIVTSLPWTSLFNNSLVFSTHFLAVVGKTSALNGEP